jgi:type IV pilus assembly protein PilB
MRERELDLRVSTVPTLFGEKVVMRLLDRASLELDMSKLGFEPEALVMFEKAILAPYGMILATGPTGSGKTTTLYSALNRLNRIGTNIMTAEDPIEYNLTGINQTQVKSDIGLTFAALLRSFLRQDPDIIMVGEIRDFETAEIAIKAALTGHLVLSTVHTNDALSTVGRLISMGVPAYLVSASLNLLLAQRLVRRLCAECRTEVSVPISTLEEIGFSPQEAKSVACYRGKGCIACRDTGYRGRIGLYEVVLLNEQMRETILNGASVGELRTLQAKYAMKSLRESGLQKIREGVTAVEEVVRVTSLF